MLKTQVSSIRCLSRTERRQWPLIGWIHFQTISICLATRSLVSLSLLYFLTERVSREGKASVASVRPSVCPSVHLFSLYLFNRLTFELWVMYVSVCYDHSSPGIERQGHRSRSKVNPGRMGVVTQSVWPRSSIEDSFSSSGNVVAGAAVN